MGADDRRLAVDAGAWSCNVLTSVLIIFVNKALMTTFHFSYATTLCGMHFLSCAAGIMTAQSLGWAPSASIPLKETLIFSVVGGLSIGSANFSLMLNSVGFYQIAKLLLAPFVCVVEIFWLRKSFSVPALLSIAAVLSGVAVVTISDVAITPIGLFMAAIFVVSSGMQQVLCGHFQAKFAVSAQQLLSNTAPVQGALLLIIGPFVDHQIMHRWLLEWEVNVPGLEMLAFSCVIAVVVNISQFLCLGRFSATSFQVLGHAKTVLVLLGGVLIFKETINVKQLSGMCLAVMGMVSYGYFVSMKSSQPSKTTISLPSAKGEREPLLNRMELGLPLNERDLEPGSSTAVAPPPPSSVRSARRPSR